MEPAANFNSEKKLFQEKIPRRLFAQFRIRQKSSHSLTYGWALGLCLNHPTLPTLSDRGKFSCKLRNLLIARIIGVCLL